MHKNLSDDPTFHSPAAICANVAHLHTTQSGKAAGVLKGQEGLHGAMVDHPGPGLSFTASSGL